MCVPFVHYTFSDKIYLTSQDRCQLMDGRHRREDLFFFQNDPANENTVNTVVV